MPDTDGDGYVEYTYNDATGYTQLNSVNDNMSAAYKEANWDATYSFEAVTTDTGAQEYRYVLRFEPKADGYNDPNDLVTQIVNGGWTPSSSTCSPTTSPRWASIRRP